MRPIIFFLWFVGLVPFVAIQAQELLQYNLEEGQVFQIEQSAVQTITQTIDDIQIEMINTLGGTFRMTVERVLEDRYIILASFQSILFKTESKEFGVVNVVNTEIVDSLSGPESRMFRGLLDVPFTITMLKNGKIESVENTAAMVENMIYETGIEDERIKNSIRESVDASFGDASMANSIEPMTYLFPNKKVLVGDSWQNKYIGEVDADNTWSLDEHNAKEFVIKGTANVRLTSKEGESLSMNMSGNQITTAIIDSSSGLFSKITVDQDVKGYMSGTDLDNDEFPARIKAKITFKRI